MKALEAPPQAVDLADYKRSVHILPEDNFDDVLFTSYLMAAQSVVETGTRRPMSPRSVQIRARLVGVSRWWMPVCPVISLTTVSYTSADGTQVAVDLANIRLEMADDEPQIVFAAGVWSDAPDDAVVTLTAQVGYQPEDLPPQLRQAVILIVKDWYDAGIAVEEKDHLAVSFGCKALMRQVRYAPPAQMIGEVA